jgi:ABC-type antimicrobial peptide transport system permease subunit
MGAPLVLARSLLMAVGVGLIFGMYPAWRASRSDPVAALRT